MSASLQSGPELSGASSAPASEALLRAIAEHHRDVLLLITAEGSIFYANQETARVFGVPIAELRGSQVYDYVHPDDRARLLQQIRALTTDTSRAGQFRTELRLQRPDDRRQWIDAVASNLLHETAVNGILVSARDITDLKLAELRLADSERRFETTLWGGNIGYWDWDLASDVTLRSEGWFEITGWQAEAWYAEKNAWAERLHPDDRDAVQAAVGALLEDRTRFLEVEYRIRCADGTWRWMLERGRVVERSSEGVPLKIAGTSTDVQERKLAQQALRLSEYRYRTVAEFTPGFVQEFEIHGDGRTQLTWASDGFDHVFGKSLAEVMERGSWHMFCRPDQLAALPERSRRLQRGEQTQAEVCIINARGEERWLETVNRPVGTNREGTTRVIGIVVDVTARRRAEERLEESETQFRLALEHAPIGIALARPDGRLVQVNRRLCEIFGYGAGDLLQLSSLAELTHPEDRKVDLQLMVALHEGARTFCDVEKRFVRRDGSEVLTMTHMAAIRDAAGQLLYLLTEVEDVTAQRAVEAALRKSEALLRAVTENVPDLLLLLDLDLRIQFANRAVMGVSPADLVGRSVLDGVPQADRSTVRAVYERAIATRAPQVYEVRDFVRGEARWFENRVGPVLQDGRILSLTVASSEITARRRAEEALRTQARIFESMREGVIVTDQSATIRLVNPALARLTGYDPRELVGRSAHIITRATRSEYLEVQADLERRLGTGQFVDIEFECVRRDGTSFTAANVITPIEIGGVQHRLGVIEDITQRRALEREIIDIANREQRRIGSDLHDGLGQELTGIALMLRGLAGRMHKENAPATGDAEEIMRLVNSAIDSTRSLARGLSPVSIERGGLPFALRALCSRVADMYGVEVRFRSKVWPQLTLDTAACNHLFRIAQEAVTNAVKHGRATEIVVDLRATGEHVQLSVNDNGAGIPPGANLALGMGLKIMRYRANMVGGMVEFGAGPDGKGTSVSMACRQPAFTPQAAVEEEGP